MGAITDRIESIERRMGPAFDELGQQIAAATAEEAPVGTHYDLPDGAARPGGSLRRSIRFEQTGETSGYIEMARHGAIVMRDQPARTIRSRRGRGMSFWWKREGIPVYGARSVNRPAIPANPFLARALSGARVQAAKRRFIQSLISG